MTRETAKEEIMAVMGMLVVVILTLTTMIIMGCICNLEHVCLKTFCDIPLTLSFGLKWSKALCE